jgi:hypothetical protein
MTLTMILDTKTDFHERYIPFICFVPEGKVSYLGINRKSLRAYTTL